jgi:hypothetical protein
VRIGGGWSSSGTWALVLMGLKLCLLLPSTGKIIESKTTFGHSFTVETLLHPPETFRTTWKVLLTAVTNKYLMTSVKTAQQISECNNKMKVSG